jgi:3',5'-cyclic AMP phosphodiesterase CpdA
MRIALTADLHWGQNPVGDQATRGLVEWLKDHPPDVLVLGGDQGTVDHFQECLALFADLACLKALVPGNHDVWVTDEDPRGDSLAVYQEHLPGLSVAAGFHYLDQGPMLLADAGLAVVGSINWYDYSWSIEHMQREVPDWEWRLRHKAFTRGRHNDGRFVRWPLDDVRFTTQVVTALEEQLPPALDQAEHVLVVTHHPPFYGLNFPREHPPHDLDGWLWDALSGNARLESVLLRHAQRIPFAFCGHTHRARENTLDNIRGYNIGGDYHFKRLLLLDWPARTVEARTFGDPEARRR